MPSTPKGYLQIITPVSAAGYADGDILSAVPWRKVRQERAEGVCFRKGLVNGKRQHTRLNDNHLYPTGDIAEDYFIRTAQFKFERLNATQGRVTRLSDMNEIVFTTNQPFTQHDGKTVQMNLDLFINRRKSSLASDGGRGRPLFGTPGNEVWYGGTEDASDAKLDLVWQDIEAKSAYLESVECDEAHFSDYRKRLILKTQNFTDEQAATLIQPEVRQRNIRFVANSQQKVPLGWRVDLLNPCPPLGDRPDAVVVDDTEEEWPVVNINPARTTIVVAAKSRPTAGQKTLQATVSRRKRRCRWRNLAGISEADVLDRHKAVRRDREIQYDWIMDTDEKPDEA